MKQFNNFSLHTVKLILAGVALALFVIALASLGGFSADPARAAEGDNVSGWAWSDNIGWISFYGDNYGVDVNETTGAFSGYAWSDAIGWINFSPDASGAPENPKTGASVDFGAEGGAKPVTGWARACAVFQIGCAGILKSDIARGGWDGWIKMQDVTLNTTATPNAFSGWAWGADVVGWIDMSRVAYGGAPVAPPAVLSVAIIPETQSVESGTNANITWEVRNATAGCTDTPSGWWKRSDGSAIILDASSNGAGTVSVGPITVPTTYTLECADNTTTVSDSAIVNANPFIESFIACNGAVCGASVTILNGGTAEFRWDTANYAPSSSCTLNGDSVDAVCTGGGGAEIPCTRQEIITLPVGTSFGSYDYTLSCPQGASSKTATVNVRNQDFILQADPVGIKITSIGGVGDAGGRGTGGVSSKTKITALANITNPITLSVEPNPFIGYDHTYRFQLAPLEGEDPVPGETEGSGSLPAARYLTGIYFWIETGEPLPAVSDTLITIIGDPTPTFPESGDERTVEVYLNSRLFDPEYREI